MHSTRSTRQRRRFEQESDLQVLSSSRNDSGRRQDADLSPPKTTDNRSIERDIWDSFREEHIDSIEQLPLYLHRNFTLMNELDRQSRASSSKLLPILRDYMRLRRESLLYGGRFASTSDVLDAEETARTVSLPISRAISCSPSSSTPSSIHNESAYNGNGIADAPIFEEGDSELRAAQHLPPISRLVSNMLHASEEKVNLAQATYDSVDRHVRILDRAIKEQMSRKSGPHRPLHSYEGQARGHPQAQLALKSRNSEIMPQNGSVQTSFLDTNQSQLPSQTQIPKRRVRTRTLGSDLNSSPLSLEDARTRLFTSAKPDHRDAASTMEPLSSLIDRQTPIVSPIIFTSGDMPIDPHEPRYCYCNQVSWGEMIACDSSDCEREWARIFDLEKLFHLNCAGLTEAPKGKTKWYCDGCKHRMASGGNRRRQIH